MQNILILTTLIATSAAWVIPTYVVRETSTLTVGTFVYTDISSTFIDKFTETNIVTLSITTAPAGATPITTTTSTDFFDDLTILNVELAAADLPTPLPTAPSEKLITDGVEHIYIQKETFSNPASCSNAKPWSYSSRVTVYVPSEATYQLKPTSESTRTFTGYGSGYIDVPHETTIYHFLTPGTVPTPSYDDDDGVAETDACNVPFEARYNYSDEHDDDDYSVRPKSTSGSSDSSSTWDEWLSERKRYKGKMKTWILIIIILLPCIFVLGFVESYFWFTKLMKGRSALRGGTVLWVFISLWAACLIRSENAGADQDWREKAEATWNARGPGEKLKLWLMYGFRWSYPVAVMGQRSLPPKYVHIPMAGATTSGTVNTGETDRKETGETDRKETGERAAEGQGWGSGELPYTSPYVDATRNPI